MEHKKYEGAQKYCMMNRLVHDIEIDFSGGMCVQAIMPQSNIIFFILRQQREKGS